MTNYDWLVTNKQLHNFIWDINNFTKEQLKEKYGIIVKWGDVVSEKIADWLQSPRYQDTNVRKVNCSMTEDEYNKGLNDLRKGMIEAAKSSCEDCQFFERCPKMCVGLVEPENFPDTSGCKKFQPADDKTRQYRKICKQIIQYVKEKE